MQVYKADDDATPTVWPRSPVILSRHDAAIIANALDSFMRVFTVLLDEGFASRPIANRDDLERIIKELRS